MAPELETQLQDTLAELNATLGRINRVLDAIQELQKWQAQEIARRQRKWRTGGQS